MPTHDNNATLKLDALFTILEKHLYDFEDTEESEVAFINKIVTDYLAFLTSKNVVVPRRFQAQITEELQDHVKKMLIKKMYGCLSIEEYTLRRSDEAGHKTKKRDAKRKYSKLW